jgi:hypothetical protein
VPALVRVVDFAPVDAPRLAGVESADGVTFSPSGSGWQLLVLSGDAELSVTDTAIGVVLDGTVAAGGSRVDAPAFLAARDEHLSIDGSAVVARGV